MVYNTAQIENDIFLNKVYSNNFLGELQDWLSTSIAQSSASSIAQSSASSIAQSNA